MDPISVTELRSNIYQLLDEVLETGVPLEIKKGGQRLRIAPVGPLDKFANMELDPSVVEGDPAELVHVEWEYNIDLP